MALVNTFAKPTNAPISDASQVAKQVANGRSTDRLTSYLQQGVDQSPTALAGQYGQMFDETPGGFSFGEASSLGMDPTAAAAINARTRELLNKNVGFRRADLLRSSTDDYMKRMGNFQTVSDAVTRQRMLEEQIRAKKKAEKAAKRSGLGAAVGGLVGAGAGLYFGAGNPGVAMAGAGAGSALGSQLG